jgi:serine/threonine-protein kinase
VTCPDDNLVAAYVEGSLDGPAGAALDEHLESCDACRSLVRALEGGGDPVDPLVGQVLAGAYHVRCTLGRGGMGTVYAADHLALGRRVAVKVMHREWRQHPDLLARFHNEARVCGRLGNPHIVEVHDFLRTDDGSPFIVMEHLDGESLAQRLGLDGPLTVAQVVQMMTQVCSALACAHGEGILHRDLKPANIFLLPEHDEHDHDGVRVKVLDFGLSKAPGALASVTGTMEIIGTPAYLAPEMARGRSVDHRADLFALGVVAYEALSGRRPFEGQAIPAILYQVVHEDPPPLASLRPETPRRLSELIARLLAKSPDDRPQDAETVLGALDALKRPEELVAPPPAGAVRSRTGWTWIAVGSVAVLASAAAVIWRASTPETGAAEVPPPAPPAAARPVDAGTRDRSVVASRVDGPAPPRPRKRTTRAPARKELTGRLVVISDTKGAEVWLDGTRVAQKTPARLTRVAPGQHVLQVLTRLRSFERTIRIARGRETRIQATLVPVRGRLTVRSRPPGARVTVDGKPIGKTPVTVDPVPAGPHAVEVTKEGYKPWRGELEITSQTRVRHVNAVLREQK